MAYTYRNTGDTANHETASFPAARPDLVASGRWALISDTLDATAIAAVAAMNARLESDAHEAALIEASRVRRSGASGVPLGRGIPGGVASLDDAGDVPLDQLDNLTAPNDARYVRAYGGGLERLAVANTGAAYTVNLAAGNVHKLTLTAAAVTLALTGATNASACSMTLYLIQDGTGHRTVTWPVSVKWPGAAAPALSVAAGAVDLVIVESLDGGSTWQATLAALDLR